MAFSWNQRKKITLFLISVSSIPIGLFGNCGQHNFQTVKSSAELPSTDEMGEDVLPQSCFFNGNEIEDGESVTVVESSVDFGQTCKQESRVCTNGVLSGSYSHDSCNIESYSWNVGNTWSTCANTVESRAVSCKNSLGMVVEDIRCMSAMPVALRSCTKQGVASGTTDYYSIRKNGIGLSESNFSWKEIFKHDGKNGRWSAAISDTGQIIVSAVQVSNDYGIQPNSAGHLKISYDGGVNWQLNTSASWKQWVNVKMSGDGRVMAATTMSENATNGYVYVSVDYGQTWKRQDNLGLLWTFKAGLFVSRDGSIIGVHDRQCPLTRAKGDLNAHVSYDSGANWQQIKVQSGLLATSKNCALRVSFSSDKKTIGVIAEDMILSNSTIIRQNVVYLSQDAGRSFTKVSLLPTRPTGYMNGVIEMSISDDGSKITILNSLYDRYSAKNQSNIFISNDAGKTWQQRYTSLNQMVGSEMSGDGNTSFFVDLGWDWSNNSNFDTDGITYHGISSIDGGVTWQANYFPAPHVNGGVALSRDGKKAVVVNSGGGLWIGSRP